MKTSLLEIYKIFFLIGLQLLGGGYVIVPLLKKYIVEERNWLTEEELVDYFAMSQCIPGIIAGNISICTGYKVRGIMGAVMAILGIISPCFVCIIILAHLLTKIADYKIIQNAFWGIRISVIILVLVTIKDLWKKSVNSKFTCIIFVLMLVILLCSKISPTVVIISSALLGWLYNRIKGGKTA